ncbi:MAG: CofH family radical SAM protein [Candidatus Thermoplasmatota archaeon]|nr:CofH family radical SAM protein [Candidatus Thermoplasmatota archaeon]MCL5666144.1 CofH family radical SAM protein [Candidatus Thermoplasmatota archaeon]
MIKTDQDLDEIGEKARSGREIGEDDIVYMYDYADINQLGRIAGSIAREISGNKVSFVSNMIMNYTNICNVRCSFCAFYRTGKENDSYTMTIDQVVSEIRKYYDAYGIKQLLIQGGVNPSLDLEYYLNLFSRIRDEFPGLGIHGLSTSEISFISKKARISVRDLLDLLRKNGLETIPGAGAEIFDDDVRRILNRPRGSGQEWLDIMETAHSMGIRTSATMMFGHVEASINKAHHLLSILKLQKKYGGFLSFTPWNFEPGNTRLEREGYVKQRSSSEDVLRNIAIARIVFNKYLPVIQTSWLTNGIEMGQLAIIFGANDWGGTIYNEKVIPATGKDVGNLKKDLIIDAVRQIGMIPVERDNLYHEVSVF